MGGGTQDDLGCLQLPLGSVCSAPSRAFSIVATINTSCGQLMISPRGDDDMVAQV